MQYVHQNVTDDKINLIFLYNFTANANEPHKAEL